MKLRIPCTITCLACIVTGVAPFPASASSPNPQETRGAASKKLVIHAGALIDVEAGTVLSDKWILVDGDRIVAIQSQSPSEREIVDWSGDRKSTRLNSSH